MSYAALKRDLGAAQRVDDDTGRVGRVPHLELELDVERHVAEVAALEADVRPLAVVQPRHVVRRADVHVVGRDALVDLTVPAGIGSGDQAQAAGQLTPVGKAPPAEQLLDQHPGALRSDGA